MEGKHPGLGLVSNAERPAPLAPGTVNTALACALVA